MGTLLREFSACCMDQSGKSKPFQFRPAPASTLMRRALDMTHANLLTLGGGQNFDPECTGGPPVVRVLSLIAPRIVVAPNKRTKEGIAVSAQMGAYYARMEVQGQPWGGWPVDVHRQWCPCNYWFVFGACVHVIFALRVSAHVDSSGQEVLVSRKKRKRSGIQTFNRGGRPPAIGQSLGFV